MLEVTQYQGINFVKKTKINIHIHQYKLFKMNSNEIIAQIFTRFTAITNDFNALGMSYSSIELVKKILRIFPKVQKQGGSYTRSKRSFLTSSRRTHGVTNDS